MITFVYRSCYSAKVADNIFASEVSSIVATRSLCVLLFIPPLMPANHQSRLDSGHVKDSAFVFFQAGSGCLRHDLSSQVIRGVCQRLKPAHS